MRLRISARFVLVILLALSLPAAAENASDLPAVNRILQAVPAPKDVTLDGSLKEWNRQASIVTADHVQHPKHIARLAAMYDADGVYLALEVRDPTPMANRVDPVEHPGQGWRNDCVQLRIDTSPGERSRGDSTRLRHVDCYWYAGGERPVASVVFGNLAGKERVEYKLAEAIGNGVEAGFRRREDGRGYIQEMRLDWRLLRPGNPVPYRPGESLSMAVEIVWGSDPNSKSPAWRLNDLLANDSWQRQAIYERPETWGRLQFVAEDAVRPTETAPLWERWVRRLEKGPTATGRNKGEVLPCDGGGNVCRMINDWFTEGIAAGNINDWYDNRDGDHSPLDLRQFPQVRPVQYSEPQRRRRLHWGLALHVRPHPTVGNSSTADKAERGGSNPRHAYARPVGMRALHRQYRGNNLYVYPEHQDYDPGHNGLGGWGDLYPLNSPYLLISQGSSGSDRPFVEAVLRTMAAFRPEVKEKLIKRGLLMPTIQALFRRSNRQVRSPDDYFTGKAHPPVFQGEQIDREEMVRLAHEMTAGKIPPLVRLKVTGPTSSPADGAMDERLCDTPQVIARVFRRRQRHMRLRVSAADSMSPSGRPLQYRWVVLQGDPNRVMIDPSDDGQEATVKVGWHDRFRIRAKSEMQSNRVDIGVFAGDGNAWSAPGFICVYCPDNELRTYDEQDRLVDVYRAGRTSQIGYPTKVLLPARRHRNYHVRDWPALIRQACRPGEGLARRLLHAELTPDEQDVIEEAGEEFTARRQRWKDRLETFREGLSALDPASSEPDAEASDDLPGPKQAAYIGQPLWMHRPAMGTSVKNRLEGVFNAWLNDPAFYVRHQDELEAIMADSPKARKQVAHLRSRLVELGILRQNDAGRFELYSVREGFGPAASRMTAYERSELARLHLQIINEILLPGIVAGKTRANLADPRLVEPEPVWEVYTQENDDDGEPTVPRKRT